MNHKINSIIKLIIFTFIGTFSFHLFYSQTNIDQQNIIKIDSKDGVMVEFKMNETIYFEDSLSILLTGFSHKHPYVGGPTKATAHLSILKGKSISEEITLSIDGIEGKPEVYYESKKWKEYEFKLRSFNYDQSIGVLICKNK